ncbi:hypothetical protein TrRE_jg11170, partial [Triparma retinervis]
MAIEHAGLLHILYEEEEDSELWKQVDEGKWEGKQRAMDLKNVVDVGSSVEEGKKAKHTFNAQFRRAVEDAKKADDGLLVDGLRYDLWFNIVGPALVARMGQVTVKRLQQYMEDMRAGGIGEVNRIQGKGAMQAGPKYWTLLNPSGGGNGTKTDETWRRYVKVLGCLLAWLVDEIKLPSL